MLISRLVNLERGSGVFDPNLRVKERFVIWCACVHVLWGNGLMGLTNELVDS